MGKTELLQSQCEQIEKKLDSLSDWEKEFYLYVLLSFLSEKYRNDTNLMDPQKSIDAIAKHELLKIASILDTVRESLVYDLF